jgi:hypothetical protein
MSVCFLTREEFSFLRRHPEINDGERRLLEWQYGCASDFYGRLMSAISYADEDNLARIELGFPKEAQAYRDFAYTGQLGRKVEQILNKKN